MSNFYGIFCVRTLYRGFNLIIYFNLRYKLNFKSCPQVQEFIIHIFSKDEIHHFNTYLQYFSSQPCSFIRRLNHFPSSGVIIREQSHAHVFLWVSTLFVSSIVSLPNICCCPCISGLKTMISEIIHLLYVKISPLVYVKVRPTVYPSCVLKISPHCGHNLLNQNLIWRKCTGNNILVLNDWHVIETPNFHHKASNSRAIIP